MKKKSRPFLELASNDELFTYAASIPASSRRAVLKDIVKYLIEQGEKGELDIVIRGLGRLHSADMKYTAYTDPNTRQRISITSPRKTIRFKASRAIKRAAKD